MKNLAKTYRIETERLVLRCYQPSDAPLLKKSIDDSLPELLTWMPWAKNEPESLEKKIERLRAFRGQFDLGQDYVFGVFNLDETVLIGSSGLHTRAGANIREIGYWIHSQQTNQGYATEVTRALTKVGFEIEDLDKIELRCDLLNAKSAAIPKKLGYHHEATMKRRVVINELSQLIDVMHWTMFREEYDLLDIKLMPLKAFDVLGKEIKIEG